MGYTKSQVDIPSLKTGNFISMPWFVEYTKKINGTTYGNTIKISNIDFSKVDYIYVIATIKTSAGNGSVKCSAGTTTLNETLNQADGTSYEQTLDCTAVGSTENFTIELKNDGANDTWLYHISFYHIEA